MKKLLLFSLFCLLISIAWASAPGKSQLNSSEKMFNIGTDSLELFDLAGNKINNSTIRILSTDPSIELMVGKVRLKNNTTSDLLIYAHKTVDPEVAGSTNSFCLNPSCYGPLTFTSTIVDSIHSGAIDTSFYIDYFPSGFGGLTTFTFEFYDSISHATPIYAKTTIEFLVSAAGVSEEKLIFKGPYPNPASQTATFEYNLPASYSKAQLIIRNMLGVEVENVFLKNNSGRKTVDVSNFSSGIYFYSFILDGKVIQAKKLIVKH